MTYRSKWFEKQISEGKKIKKERRNCRLENIVAVQQ